MDKEQYFNELTSCRYSALSVISPQIAQQKKAATALVNGLNRLLDQIEGHITDDEDYALKQVIKLVTEVQQVRQVAASAARRDEEKAQAAAAKVEADEKRKIEQRLFGECSNEEQIVTVANAFIEFSQDMDMKPFLYQHYSMNENKAKIIDSIYEDRFIKEFSFESFETFCDQKMTEARFSPKTLNRSEEAALSL
ncbi:MAG: hypothetical protein N0C90_13010 [Candidatus Thiodiazotropha endolucinida]|nr:hypothetical protein [Candidatus Thiodiazotropha taylori]MCW4262281.1 hypothetical protein [Candidatus Thiodiazotropha endolucinida]